MTPATASSAAAAVAAGGNHYYANISQQHDQCKKNTCSNMATDATQVTLLIDYNFARKLDYRRWLRRWSCVRAALQSQRRRRRGTPQPVCRRPIARKSTFFPKPKRQIFVWRLCWLLLLGITIQFSHAIW